jgi:iron complex outermembrane receptor protein
MTFCTSPLPLVVNGSFSLIETLYFSKMKSISTLLFLFISLTAHAQISVQVRDASTQKPLDRVSIKVNQGKEYWTDAEGKANLEEENPVRVLIFKEGFKIQIAALTAGSYEFELQENALSLAEISVSAFESERPLLAQSASISLVTERDFNRFSETSIVNSFNTNPGIRIEERAPASYRISIRGSSLRSPFGVRNVKVYWNDVPFTSPDGTTPLNLLDLSNIQTAEVIKGPAGSIYGAGNGGTISLNSKANPQGGRVAAEWMSGDFGLNRYRIGISQQVGQGGFEASFVSQKSEGYRAHSAVDRQVFQLASFFPISAKQEIRTQVLISDLKYQIPGALTEAQVNEDPTLARPGSANQNSSIAQKTVFASIGHLYRFSQNTSNQTTVYLQTNDFENPFILDYKRELGFGTGGRTRFTHDGKIAGKAIRLITGAEYQTSLTNAQNFGNRAGKADTIRFADKLQATQAFLFQQVELQLTSKFLFTLGMSQNFSSFDIDRQVNTAGGKTRAQTRKFDPILIPRLALNYQWNAHAALYGSLSSGFSPPTIDEVRTNEGSLNLDLEAERGINYELGFRWSKNRFNADITTFYFKLDETITTFTNAQGVVLFRNAGATDQKGVEGALDYDLVKKQAGFIRDLKLGTAITLYDFEFVDYQKQTNDFSGNALTGVPSQTFVSRLDLRTALGFYVNLTHQYVNEIPLNDANTVFQPEYNLVNIRLGWSKRIKGNWELEAFGGVDNLLDEAYSLGNDLNAFAGRFYQPAPTRNFYGGVKLALNY